MNVTTIELTDPETRYLKMILFARLAIYHDQQNHAASHGEEFFDKLDNMAMDIIDKIENE